MAAGIVAALVFPFIFPGTLPLYVWPLLFLISIGGCLVGTYAAPPTDPEVLKNFYRTVRPWGFWKPVHAQVIKEHPDFQPNKRFKLDMFNVVLGIIAQCCLTILPMYVVMWLKLPLLITILILALIVLILKRTWWDKLEN
jgi:MFS family permease